ncbi:MAG: hypothetical protein R3E01_13715 [Pirellulaceae bacterium]|nr:hypothetical protein [Planctomycetales bacterium]
MKRTPGYTLLETVLAVALTSVIMLLIVNALHMYTKLLDVRRTRIEEVQLARAVLGRITDDLRGTIPHIEVEFPQTTSGGGGSGGGGSGGGGSGGGGSSGGGSGGTGSGGASSTGTNTGTAATSTTTSSSVIPTIAGLYGNPFELQIDVSRLPRPDEYLIFDDSGSVMGVDVPSDTKTIAYYVNGVSGSATTTGHVIVKGSGPVGGMTQGGLVRRSLDRGSTQYAANNNLLVGLDATSELMAAEVIALEFMYFDGVAWTNTWDSEERAGLPMAVMVTVALSSDPTQTIAAGTLNSSLQSLPSSTGAIRYYRTVISLPSARPTDEATMAAYDAAEGS